MSRDYEGDWREQALCAEVDPELFFPEKGRPNSEAAKICGRCAVQSECREDALQSHARFGIWGGLTERGRRRENRNK
jgi:WhiB family redox-sensing transcriptional regulator